MGGEKKKQQEEEYEGEKEKKVPAALCMNVLVCSSVMYFSAANY
jgi:hypothetical protein